MGVTELVFELYTLKAKIKRVFSRSYCCYGNLLCHKINSNLFPDDWTVYWYHDVGVNKHRVVVMTHQTLRLEKYWKLFPATLNYHSRKHKLFNIIWIRYSTCKIRRLNQLSNFSSVFDCISRIFDWLALNWNMSHLIDLDVAFCMHLIRQFDLAHVKCDV